MAWCYIKEKVRSFKKKYNKDLDYIFNQIPGNFYWKNLEGQYLGCNEGTLKVLALKKQDFIGKTDQILWPLQAKIFKQFEEKIIAGLKPEDLEISVTLSSGENKIFLIASSLWVEETTAFIIGNLMDITHPKNNEMELKKKCDSTALYLEKVIDGSPGNLYWKNTNRIYLGCNQNTIKVSKLNSKVDILGKSDEELWPDNAESIRENDLFVLQTGKTVEKEEEVGGRIYLSTKMPLRDEKNNIIGIIGNSVDITTLKETEASLRKTKEELEFANKAKTEFLENMRHDIRTPLSGIVGFAELLNDEDDKDKIKEYTSSLVESSKELLRFLNEILESINVASGEIPLLKKKFNLKTTLLNVIKLHQPKAVEKKLNIDLQFDKTIPVYLIGDPVRIYRIVLELLVNALKFTKHGDIHVSAKLAKKNNRDVVIKVEVEDTGPGIPSEKQQELFVRFKRFSPSYQGIYKGTGLGLSIVKQFIDDLQGEIYIESHPNQGTKFICVIPLKETLLDEPLGEEVLSSQLSPSVTSIETVFTSKPNETLTSQTMLSRVKVHVLIVEDQKVAANIAKTILTNMNCSVDIAMDGKTALQLFANNTYDLILMDIGLPDIDGSEVTKQIRLLETPSGHRIPIIGLTAHIDTAKKQALDMGMNIIIPKPLTCEVATNLLKDFITE